MGEATGEPWRRPNKAAAADRGHPCRLAVTWQLGWAPRRLNLVFGGQNIRLRWSYLGEPCHSAHLKRSKPGWVTNGTMT
jgi:hypothetical protein